MWLKALFPFRKVKFSRIIATYVEKKFQTFETFEILHAFPISKVLVFEGNS